MFHHLSAALTAEAKPFPQLRFLRDLDLDSDLLRQGVRHLEFSQQPLLQHTPPLFDSYINLLSLWSSILSRAGEVGVWIEDQQGLNLTRANLVKLASNVSQSLL